MAYRIAIAGAKGPFVGPWICSVGTEYAVEVAGTDYAVLEYTVKESDKILLQSIPAQRSQFPSAADKYRVRLTAHSDQATSVRVFLK